MLTVRWGPRRKVRSPAIAHRALGAPGGRNPLPQLAQPPGQYFVVQQHPGPACSEHAPSAQAIQANTAHGPFGPGHDPSRFPNRARAGRLPLHQRWKTRGDASHPAYRRRSEAQRGNCACRFGRFRRARGATAMLESRLPALHHGRAQELQPLLTVQLRAISCAAGLYELACT